MTFVNVGETLAGKYRVDKILGVGGMGMVVAATHLELEQRVALKFMLPDALGSAVALERFLREARAAVRLRSEHVCRVLDVGRLETGAPYIVMEYMEGRDFAQLLAQQGPLPIAVAVDHVLQAIEGVAEAHAIGIVHRDLKPGNLFVTTDSDGTPLVKVLDFGISKTSFAGEAVATKTGDFMGSPAYMAPEQMASAKHVDPRADLWAMGVILFQALAGMVPFDGETLPSLCLNVMGEPPRSLRAVRPDVPATLEAIVLRCLEKEPDRRYPHLGELSAALAPFGSSGATARATRISKVLRQPSRDPVAEVSIDATVPATAPPPVVPARSVVGAMSTLGGSAAEIGIATQPRRGRSGWIAGAIALASAGVLAVVIVSTSSGSGTPRPSAATRSTPLDAAPEPAPAAMAPPIEAPVDAAPADPVVTLPPVEAKPARQGRRKSTSAKPTSPIATEPVAVEAKPEPTPPTEEAPPQPKSKWTRMQHDKKQ